MRTAQANLDGAAHHTFEHPWLAQTDTETRDVLLVSVMSVNVSFSVLRSEDTSAQNYAVLRVVL